MKQPTCQISARKFASEGILKIPGRIKITLLLLALSSIAYAQKGSNPSLLRLSVETKLGVKQEFEVSNVGTSSDVLDGVAYSNYKSDWRLVLFSKDSVYYFIPWAMIKEGVASENGHTITLTDNSELKGKLFATAGVAGENKAYTLASTNRFTVLGAPEFIPRNWSDMKPGQPGVSWRLTTGTQPPAFEVTAPHFIFRYYTNEGYVLGGIDRTAKTLSFKVKVGDEDIGANLSDFEMISYAAGKDIVTVKAPGASSIPGKLTLSARDSKGDHTAYSGWMLFATLKNGIDVGIMKRDWELVRQ